MNKLNKLKAKSTTLVKHNLVPTWSQHVITLCGGEITCEIDSQEGTSIRRWTHRGTEEEQIEFFLSEGFYFLCSTVAYKGKDYILM